MAQRLFLLPSLLLFAALLSTGCVHYEYDIVSPPELRQHIGAKEQVRLKVEPLEYRMISYEDHLVIEVFNPTADNIQFIGEQSTAVDPSGQSHPLRGQAIPPGSYMKLVLPPVVHYQTDPGPHIGFGIGVGYVHGGPWRDGLGFDQEMWDEPRYVAVVEPGVGYWEWNGESDARLMLTFQRGNEKPFTHSWVFHRKKM